MTRTKHQIVAIALLTACAAVAAAQNAAQVAAPVAAAAAAAQSGGGSAPMIEITKTCPRLRYLSREATFEITVTNRGNAPAANVVVSDTLTGGTDFISADNGGNRQGDRVVWSLGNLDAGQSKVLKVNTRCSRIGTVKNTAVVTYCAQAMAQCEMEIKGIPAILLECVDDNDPIEVGADLTYTIIVTNQGSQTDSNVTIKCTLPPEQQFVRAGGATAGTNSGSDVSFAPLPSLAPKARATWTVTVKGIKPGDSRFKVVLTSDQTTSPVFETESSHIYD